MNDEGAERAASDDPGARTAPRRGETSGKTISWNRPPREDRGTI